MKGYKGYKISNLSWLSDASGSTEGIPVWLISAGFQTLNNISLDNCNFATGTFGEKLNDFQ